MIRTLRYALLLMLPAGMWTASCGKSGDSFGNGGSSPFPPDCSKQCPSGLCDSSIGCVECIANSDCKDPGSPICVLGRCRACGSKADCGTSQTCSPITHECVTACTSNTSCTQDNAPLCDTMTGACVQCLTNMNCTTPPLCDTTLGRCVECMQNSDCGVAAPYCDIANGHCEQCLLDSQCTSGRVCMDHECVVPPAPCTTDANCAGELPHCNTTTGKCVQCTVNTQCTNTETPYCSPNDTCVQCLTNAQCGTGGICDNFQCHGG